MSIVHAPPSDALQPTVGSVSTGWFALQLLRARLRFLLAVAAIFLLLASWPRLAAYWDGLVIWVTNAEGESASTSSASEFFCPMCPGVLSAWPERCPVCKMPLVKRQLGEAVLLPEGVTARMQLSPYRIQLAGIKTSVVGYLPLAREVRASGQVVAAPGGGKAAEKILADISPLDVPYLGIHQLAEATCQSLPPGTRINATVEGWEAGSVTSAGGVRLRLRLIEGNDALLPGMRMMVSVKSPLAELPPYSQEPRNSPALTPAEPRSVFACPDHPNYLFLGEGTCPFDENPLDERKLLDNQRLAWRCPAHGDLPIVASGRTAAPGCSRCRNLLSAPRIVTYSPPGKVLAVPDSAVIETGSSQTVFIEKMPGMFDALEVEVGQGEGGFRPVLRGLSPGDRVVQAGAFLLDAETRLNPSLASSYFGAGGGKSGGSSAIVAAGEFAPSQQVNQDLLAKLKLSPDELLAARRQKICPVTGMALGSMGKLAKVQLADRTVFLCCEGCRSRVRVAPAPAASP